MWNRADVEGADEELPERAFYAPWLVFITTFIKTLINNR